MVKTKPSRAEVRFMVGCGGRRVEVKICARRSPELDEMVNRLRQSLFEEIEIISGWAGTISNVYVGMGQTIKPGEGLLRIYDAGRYREVFYGGEKQAVVASTRSTGEKVQSGEVLATLKVEVDN